jgi:DNA helicase-2/ATP-dependent DNA helicase PcrA
MFVTRTEASLGSLNEGQMQAATHPGGPLLILAGAGTGKTTTLCARVAWLVERGVPAERILLLTFTRRAAREMLSRARTLVAVNANSRFVVGGTFHSVGYRTILSEAPALGLGGVNLLDASDGADLLDLLREELGLASMERRFPRKGTLLDIYSRTVNAQRSLSEVLGESFPWCADFSEEIASLFRTYTARKRLLNATIAGFAAFKDHLSYLPFSGSVLPQLADELTGYTTTKSALHFPIDRPPPKTLVNKLIRMRLAEVARLSR